ncbi:hypothetical protein E2C01_054431 [Portunus trituberculatus]|uniref:Uncharacterized protein n=1 Tax=Portunus trituberculatus TaxID=210409 RepID=A0A5B7GTN5_PORTR|nr:hypothetical protein [Portunus trituberculatus]
MPTWIPTCAAASGEQECGVNQAGFREQRKPRNVLISILQDTEEPGGGLGGVCKSGSPSSAWAVSPGDPLPQGGCSPDASGTPRRGLTVSGNCGQRGTSTKRDSFSISQPATATLCGDIIAFRPTPGSSRVSVTAGHFPS